MTSMINYILMDIFSSICSLRSFGVIMKMSVEFLILVLEFPEASTSCSGRIHNESIRVRHGHATSVFGGHQRVDDVATEGLVTQHGTGRSSDGTHWTMDGHGICCVCP